MSKLIVLGGYSGEAEDMLLHNYVFSAARQQRPKVCFVGTASGDAVGYSEMFFSVMKKHDIITSELSLFRPPVARSDLEAFILEKDVIFVGGGNTFNLMALWRAWNLEPIFRKAMDQGVILAGMSAGAICWFESGVSDSFVSPSSKELDGVQGLGFLKGSMCPHYDSETSRRSEYHRLVRNKELNGGIALEDGVAATYENGVLVEVASSRPDGKAFYVSLIEKGIREETLPVRMLG